MRLRLAIWVLMGLGGVAGAKGPAVKVLTVGASGAEFTTIQAAVNAAPAAGAAIRIAPGVYREVVHVDKPGIQLRGMGEDAAKVVLVYGNSAASTCGTGCSATLFVTGKDFFAGGMTISNDYGRTGEGRTGGGRTGEGRTGGGRTGGGRTGETVVPSQAVAVSVRADRAVFRQVRLLGAQDTLYASSLGCMKDGGECTTGRQYFVDCYIEGHMDFIFGDAKAVFEGCEIRSIAHAAGGYVTAQSNTRKGQDAGYVFNHCRLTADEGAGVVYLGRPWRDYSTVIYMNTEMGAHITGAGWSEWKSAPVPRLPTAFYAEFNSSGPGAKVAEREGLAKQLSAGEAKGYETKVYLRGSDGWDPTAVK